MISEILDQMMLERLRIAQLREAELTDELTDEEKQAMDCTCACHDAIEDITYYLDGDHYDCPMCKTIIEHFTTWAPERCGVETDYAHGRVFDNELIRLYLAAIRLTKATMRQRSELVSDRDFMEEDREVDELFMPYDPLVNLYLSAKKSVSTRMDELPEADEDEHHHRKQPRYDESGKCVYMPESDEYSDSG
jgi:hypothetical protein